jgi:hypothetical protein
LTLVVATGAVLTACGGANSLDGSVGELVSLDFSRTRLTKQEAVLTIDYIRDTGGDLEELTLRLTIDTTGMR